MCATKSAYLMSLSKFEQVLRVKLLSAIIIIIIYVHHTYRLCTACWHEMKRMNGKSVWGILL